MTKEENENLLKRQAVLEDKIEQMEEHLEAFENLVEQVLEQMQELNKNFIKLAEMPQTMPMPLPGLF